MALDPETRKKMGEQALQLARKVGYSSAGTVEFLVDKHKSFYFLEMNTRLQVEHPITEYITGLDLVEHMIRVAAGQKLSIKQKDVKINGWAFESRVYAEDPKLFLPSIGRLQKYIEPLESGNSEIRCDSGIKEGSEISIYYDPLICKLCTHGPDREMALSTMQRALDSYVIRGVTHNIPLIRQVLGQKRFQDGRITTNYLPEEFPKGFEGHKLTPEESRKLISVAVSLYMKQSSLYSSGSRSTEELFVKIDGQTEEWTVKNVQDGIFCIINSQGNAENISMKSEGELKISSPLIRVKVNEEPLVVQNHGSPYLGQMSLQAYGTTFYILIQNRLEKDLSKYMLSRKASSSERIIKAPMAGQIVSLSVNVGDTVREGGEVAVIEAMKMQNILRAPKAGKVTSIKVTAGQNVSSNQPLIEFEFL